MKPYHIVLTDDHVLFRRGLKKIIEDVDGLQVVGEAPDGLELLRLLKVTTPEGILRACLASIQLFRDSSGLLL